MASITNNDLTNKTEDSEGTGTFDLLMGSVNLHLAEQFLEGRLSGAEYASVYLGAMSAVLQQSITFLLQKQESDKKADLVSEQITLTKTQNSEVSEKVLVLKAEVKQITAQIVHMTAQDTELAAKAKESLEKVKVLTAQELLTDEELLEVSAKIVLVDAQVKEVDAKTNEIGERTDLVVAQTAKTYEDVKSSQDTTIRENIVSNATVSKLAEEIDLLGSKDLEEIASTVRRDSETKSQIIELNHKIAVLAQQEQNLTEKNGDVVTTYTYYTNGKDATNGTTTTISFGNVIGPVLSTSVGTGIGISTTELDKNVLVSKEKLINAQTLGFVSDTKQKLLKQMNDSFAVVLSIAALGNVPEASQDAAIDQLTQEILDDVGTGVRIQSVDQVPDDGTKAPLLPIQPDGT